MPVRSVAGDGRSVFAQSEELRTWLNAGQVPAVNDDSLIAASSDRAPGLLVLPFEYRGPGGSDHAFIGDAVSAELLNRLATAPLSALRVISWTTARLYRESKQRADEIAAQLGIHYLVEGAVTDVGSRWIIEVRVVDALQDRVLFADCFSCAGTEAMRLLGTIAEAVSGHLALHLDGHVVEPFWAKTVDPSAFLAYIRAQQAITHNWTDANLRQAIALTSEAIRLDPNFAPAYALKGTVMHIYGYYFAVKEDSIRDETRALGIYALQYGPQLASTNILDAAVAAYYDCDWDRSEARYAYVLRHVPSDAHARRNLARVLGFRERWDAATQTLSVAQTVDRSRGLLISQAAQLNFRRQYDQAAHLFDLLLKEQSDDSGIAYSAIVALGLNVRDKERLQSWLDRCEPALLKQWEPFFAGLIAVAQDDRRALALARQQVRDRAQRGAGGYWYNSALLAGAAGDADGIVEGLGQAIEAGEGSMVAEARIEPVFDCARQDPRFLAHLKHVNLV